MFVKSYACYVCTCINQQSTQLHTNNLYCYMHLQVFVYMHRNNSYPTISEVCMWWIYKEVAQVPEHACNDRKMVRLQEIAMMQPIQNMHRSMFYT